MASVSLPIAIFIAISQVDTALKKISFALSPIALLAAEVNDASSFAHQMNVCVSRRALTRFHALNPLAAKLEGSIEVGRNFHYVFFPRPWNPWQLQDWILRCYQYDVDLTCRG